MRMGITRTSAFFAGLGKLLRLCLTDTNSAGEGLPLFVDTIELSLRLKMKTSLYRARRS